MKKTKVAASGENVIDPKFFNFVSQIAHFFSTYAIVCVVYAALHEFWYDPRYENPVTRGSDLEDFLFLVAGVAAAVAVSAI